MISSMTGFARFQGRTEPGAQAEGASLSWSWEVRSVNGKGLDVRMRLPGGYEALEIPARDLVGKALGRGNVSATLQVRQDAAEGATQVINWPFLRQLMDLGADLPPHVAAPTLDGLLQVRGVLLAADEQPISEAAQKRNEAAILKGLEQALQDLIRARGEEGQRLLSVLEGHLDTITDLIKAAETSAALRPETVRERLHRQISDLIEGSGLSEDRLLQEVAIIATRVDVREELDRLRAHVAQAHDLLSAGGVCGRRLDFLCQEFNREANTLCSKSQDTDLTRIGLDLKAIIDQFREQVQNVE